MKILKFIISLTLTFILVISMNTKIGMLPTIGKFIDPVNGFWQNAEKTEPEISEDLKLNVNEASKIIYDERLVPHVFAGNLHDLYFLQGYVTASNRLWQMEFQTHAAAGRISEIIGAKAIPFDREQRRTGMLWSAENAVKIFSEDTLAKKIMDAYSEGVNAYINSLTEKTLPLEYRLLDYKPEQWTTLKSSLLLKYMAKMLTANERDIENTNMVNLIGKEKFDLLFPDYFPNTDPVIPRGIKFDSATVHVDTPRVITYGKPSSYSPVEKTDAHIGSNNWAVSGTKTKSEKPILCNDPHLKLSLPSIWYEIQLNAPDVNVYGVSLPGSPGVLIGFNDSIAWGVTNASVDVRDWYEITFKDDSKKEYLFNEKWLNSTARIEEIKVRGGNTFFDTVYYTHLGPVVYDEKFNSSGAKNEHNLALKWTAHSPSNELTTFYLLNRAKNYSDYEHALTYYQCPGQNFVYADARNNIAIWQQGKFPARWKEQGKYIMDGSLLENEWQAYIPQQQNPHIINPERGFVSSANQHGVDESYPYYYLGVFEHYRNRRINSELSRMQKITADSMFHLQNDNYNLMAAENLPLMLDYAKRNELKNDSVEKLVLDALEKWNYMHDAEMIGPTAFDLWWKQYTTFVLDEFEDKPYKLIKPHPSAVLQFMKEFPNDKLFIHQTTKDRTPKNAVNLSYDAFYWTGLKINELIIEDEHPQWGFQNAITVEHLARIPAFSFNNLVTGGYKYAANAVAPPNGPSWRMVVELGDKPKAWGVYPGGQSGNPGSHNYTAFVEKWAKSEYYELIFMSRENQEKGKYVQQIIPDK